MKRKLIQYLFIGLAALTFAGCGNIADIQPDEGETVIEEDDEDDDEEDDEEDDEDEKPDEK